MIPLTATVDRDGRLKQVIPGEMFEETTCWNCCGSPQRT
jgi:hypothetical protein